MLLEDNLCIIFIKSSWNFSKFQRYLVCEAFISVDALSKMYVVPKIKIQFPTDKTTYFLGVIPCVTHLSLLKVPKFYQNVIPMIV